MSRRLLEPVLITAAAIGVVLAPTWAHGWPSDPRMWAMLAALAASGITLVAWRTHPRATAILGLTIFWLAAFLGAQAWFPDAALAILPCLAAVLALGWSGRAAAVAAGVGAIGFIVAFYLVSPQNQTAVLMLVAPGFLAGTALRLRQQTGAELAQRGRELEEERELFAELTKRNERARIAAELHDIVGHAISVMVIQAAAGQRLVESDPERAGEAFAAIAESARQGRKDLQRLVELLGRSEVGGPDLAMVDEVVARASRTGLRVSCRFEGDRDGVAQPVAQLAYRVVQESLTNALRHAPGAEVRVGISVDPSQRALVVRVENDAPARLAPGAIPGAAPDATFGATLAAPRAVVGTGRGLIGLRERVQALGGRLVAGPTGAGGWAVEANLPG